MITKKTARREEMEEKGLRRNVKKRAALLWLAVMLGLCACGKGEAAEPAEIPEAASTPSATPVPAPQETRAVNTILLKGGEDLDWVCGVPFEEPGYTALDAEGNDRSDQVQVTGEVVFWRPGDYELYYAFENAAGETVRACRRVHQLPAPMPETAAPEEKVIYLTFDDGPCENTERVLELLEQYDAKATFFVILSREEACAELLPKIQEQGHSIGIHAFDHEYSRLYQGETAYFADMLKAQQLLYSYTGSYAHLLRFPGGSTTAKGMMGPSFPVVQQGLADMGIQYFDWNVQPEDGKGHSSIDTAYAFARGVPNWETPVVLQHDTRIYSVNALEEMLRWGTENGYRFLALDVQTPAVHSN